VGISTPPPRSSASHWIRLLPASAAFCYTSSLPDAPSHFSVLTTSFFHFQRTLVQSRLSSLALHLPRPAS
jgi:hypothetical protein